MKVILVLMFINSFALAFSYFLRKKHREEQFFKYDKKNLYKRVGDLEEIKKKLNENEF